MLVLYAIITRRRTLSNIVGIYVVSGKVALIPMVNSIGMIYVNVVSVPIENDMCVCIYIYMSAGGLRLSDVKSYSILIIFLANLLQKQQSLSLNILVTNICDKFLSSPQAVSPKGNTFLWP
jgi:hypothetical protein